MTYYLWMSQDGEGCDYTIGCGQKLIKLKAKTMDEILKEVKGIFEDHSVNGEDVALDECLILKKEKDIMQTYEEVKTQTEADKKEDERKEKKAQLERLKQELGEE